MQEESKECTEDTPLFFSSQFPRIIADSEPFISPRTIYLRYVIIVNTPKTQSKTNTFLCGLSAGAVEATFVVTPCETIKTRLIHDKFSETPQYRNLFHGIYTIVKNNGIGGIYKGKRNI
jgi:hypothetical protein